MNPDRKKNEVVAAIIRDEDGRIFVTQRGYSEWKDWWKFQGASLRPLVPCRHRTHRRPQITVM